MLKPFNTEVLNLADIPLASKEFYKPNQRPLKGWA